MARTRYTYKYKGAIVRNSNNLYKYALVNHLDAVIACSGTEQGARRNISTHLKMAESKAAFYTKKKCPENAAFYTQQIEDVKKWHVVELEIIKN